MCVCVYVCPCVFYFYFCESVCAFVLYVHVCEAQSLGGLFFPLKKLLFSAPKQMSDVILFLNSQEREEKLHMPHG